MTQTVGTAVAERAENRVALDSAWNSRGRFEAVLPDHIDTKAFIGLAAGALYRDPKLMEAANNSPQTFVNEMLRCAALGHQPGTEEFYFTARGSKDHGGKKVIKGIEGYRGIVERMYRSGAVASVIVREVCENDHFEFVEGVNDKPVHTVDWFAGNRGRMIGVYAYAILVTGAVSRVVILNAQDIEAIKAKSDGASYASSPWKTDERSMWWKSAARRLEPWVPTSAEYRREIIRASAEAAPQPPAPAKPAETPYVDAATGEIHDAEVVGES